MMGFFNALRQKAQQAQQKQLQGRPVVGGGMMGGVKQALQQMPWRQPQPQMTNDQWLSSLEQAAKNPMLGGVGGGIAAEQTFKAQPTTYVAPQGVPANPMTRPTGAIAPMTGAGTQGGTGSATGGVSNPQDRIMEQFNNGQIGVSEMQKQLMMAKAATSGPQLKDALPEEPMRGMGGQNGNLYADQDIQDFVRNRNAQDFARNKNAQDFVRNRNAQDPMMGAVICPMCGR